jgi:hypothetical protein
MHLRFGRVHALKPHAGIPELGRRANAGIARLSARLPRTPAVDAASVAPLETVCK